MPPIHDITTDTDDPPRFVALLDERRGARNPPEYAGPAAAARQRRAYPDLSPLLLPAPREHVHAAARVVITNAGWRIVADDEPSGRLEAIATTRWLRFKDDVVVRLRIHEAGTRVDVRSTSRIGRNDFGTNARRIRAFLADLQRHLFDTP